MGGLAATNAPSATTSSRPWRPRGRGVSFPRHVDVNVVAGAPLVWSAQTRHRRGEASMSRTRSMGPTASSFAALAVCCWLVACSSDNAGGGGGQGGAAGTTGGGGGTAGAGATGGGGNTGGGGATGAAGNTGAGGTTARPDGGTAATMTFFVSSRGPGNGGNLGGLAGADAFCKSLATAVSAHLGAQVWRAYLSTTTVNAHDRIGPGPWYNAAGAMIAANLTDLHDQLATNAALNATWPVGVTNVALDETGAEVPSTPLVHDILTGSNTDGTLAAGANCSDWTSSSTTATAEVGHSNRTGGNRPPSWNAAHTVGCGAFTADNQAGTVSSGGGRGSIYCFAVPAT
jgi:hypothetical protein